MNEQANGQLQAPAQNQGHTGPAQQAAYAEQPPVPADQKTRKKNEAVLGPFTIRDLTVFGATLILFVASLIPMFALRYNLWNLGSLFFLGLGIVLPLIVSALFMARRVSPATRIRIGSLSVDQFASVVAAFAVAFFFLAVAGAFVPFMLLGLVGALGLFAATVLARLIPYFAGDFLDREEAPAHVVAREAAVPVRKPRAPKAPKAPKETTEKETSSQKIAPKEAGSRPIAGWAKRIIPGGHGASPVAATQDAATQDAAPQDGAPQDAARKAAAQIPVPASAADSAQGTAPAAAAAASGSAPQGAPSAPAPAAAADPTAGAPATEAQGVVRAQQPEPAVASAAAAPSAAEQTRVAGVGTSGASALAPAAAEETRAADLPVAANSSAPTTVTPTVRSQEPIGATVDPASRPQEDEVRPVHEAFWFAVAQPRTAVDQHTGAPVFVIEPGGWVLALEDRGHEFLVQHTDGRVGLLRDLSNVERG
ncbi:MAG: hypothetical protein JWO29_1737 [Arthrobacter sp.]|nr:hypothetical protein [Arthrobacter sp.]